LGTKVSGNLIADNDGNGALLDRTEETATESLKNDGPPDVILKENTITDNGSHGVESIGSSPDILSNTLQANTGYGIRNTVFYGAGSGSSTADDDVLSRPHIATNLILSNKGGGILSLDTAPANSSTLDQDNTIGDNSGQVDIEQKWFGLVEVVGESGATISWGEEVILVPADVACRTLSGSVAFMVDQEAKFYVSGISGPAWGPKDAHTDDVTTWFAPQEYVVENDGTRRTCNPYRISGTGNARTWGLYSFDADRTTHTPNPDVALDHATGEVAGTSGDDVFDRYQIAQIMEFEFANPEYQPGGAPPISFGQIGYEGFVQQVAATQTDTIVTNNLSVEAPISLWLSVEGGDAGLWSNPQGGTMDYNNPSPPLGRLTVAGLNVTGLDCEITDVSYLPGGSFEEEVVSEVELLRVMTPAGCTWKLDDIDFMQFVPAWTPPERHRIPLLWTPRGLP
jgi:hypothetical protein